MEEAVARKVVSVVPVLLDLPSKKLYIDYDEEADVLYVSFKKPVKATDTMVLDEGILLRYKGNELVGVTILNASRFLRNQGTTARRSSSR